MAIALAVRQSFLHHIQNSPFPTSLFTGQSLRFVSGSPLSKLSSSSNRRLPLHDFSKPCEFLGSWKPTGDPRDAEARLDRLRKDYAKQVSRLRRKYMNEMEVLRFEKTVKERAKHEAIRLANKKRKAAKSAAAVALAKERRVFQEEFRQTLLKEKAERLESWRKKEQLMEQKRTSKKELLRLQSSMWISPEKLEDKVLEAIVDTTPL